MRKTFLFCVFYRLVLLVLSAQVYCFRLHYITTTLRSSLYIMIHNQRVL